MYIKDLPEDLRKLAMQRCKEDCERNLGNFKDYSEEDTLISAFYFKDTPEGEDFWWGVGNGKIKTIPKI